MNGPNAQSPLVSTVRRVSLDVSDSPVEWEAENASSIGKHWKKEASANPALFDGTVFGVSSASLVDGHFSATCHAIRFATFLYWRDIGHPQAGFRNIFSDIALRCADGALIMGRMGPQTANAGKVYFPGGAFDINDLDGKSLDPDACSARECREEVGLAEPDIHWAPGYLIYRDPKRVAIVRIADMPWDGSEACQRIQKFLKSEETPELEGIILLRDRSDLDAAGAEPYARAIADWMFDHA